MISCCCYSCNLFTLLFCNEIEKTCRFDSRIGDSTELGNSLPFSQFFATDWPHSCIVVSHIIVCKYRGIHTFVGNAQCRIASPHLQKVLEFDASNTHSTSRRVFGTANISNRNC